MTMFKLPSKYIYLDFETNGLPKNGDTSSVDITEIAYVTVDNGEIIDTKTSLAKPSIPQPQRIIELTHITDDMLKDAKSPLEVAKEYIAPLTLVDTPIIGHNLIGFDRLFLDKYCDMMGIKRISTERYLDSAALFKTYRKGHRTKSNQWALPPSNKESFEWSLEVLERSWVDDMIKYNLDAAVGYLCIPQFDLQGDRHRALYDVLLGVRVVEALRQEMGL